MKLALCLYKYFPYGGLQQDMLRIASACLSHGHSVDVYTMVWEGDNELDLNVHVIPINARSNHQRALAFVAAIEDVLTAYDQVIGFNKMPGLDWYFASDICFQASKRREKPWWYRYLPRYKTYVALESDVFSPKSQTNIFYLTVQQKKDYQDCYHTPDERFYALPPGI